MKYKAIFNVDGGASFGLGFKFSDNYDENRNITAGNSEDAYVAAMKIASELAWNGLSNPETGFTTVKLLSLHGPEGEISFDEDESTVKVHTLAHILNLDLEDIN